MQIIYDQSCIIGGMTTTAEQWTRNSCHFRWVYVTVFRWVSASDHSRFFRGNGCCFCACQRKSDFLSSYIEILRWQSNRIKFASERDLNHRKELFQTDLHPKNTYRKRD